MTAGRPDAHWQLSAVVYNVEFRKHVISGNKPIKNPTLYVRQKKKKKTMPTGSTDAVSGPYLQWYKLKLQEYPDFISSSVQKQREPAPFHVSEGASKMRFFYDQCIVIKIDWAIR